MGVEEAFQKVDCFVMNWTIGLSSMKTVCSD